MKLIFVYNAGSGFFNVAADMAHKIFSPATYPCSLCDLTYGIFKIRPEWEAFIKNAPFTLDFLHKDEFQQAYPAGRHLALPCILTEADTQLETLVPAVELNALKTIAELKKLVLERASAQRLA